MAPFLRAAPIAVGAISALSLALGFAGLSRNELWFDEAYAALIAEQTISGIISELRNDSSPPLYYVVLHFWIKLVGSGPTALRSLSVLAAALGVCFMERLGSRLWRPEVGRCGALLLAVSPLYLYYSQQVRPYSLFLALVLASLLFHERARESSSRLNAGLYALTTVLAVYTHNYGLFLLPIYALSAIVDRLPRRLLASLAVVLCAYSLWLPVLSQQVRTGTATWVERIWLQTPPAMALVKTLAAFVIGGVVPDYIPSGSQGPIGWTQGIAFPVFAYLVFRGWSVRGSPAAGPRPVAAALALVLGVPYLVSFVKPIYVVGRYDLMGLPLFLLLATAGWWSLGRRAGRVVAGLLVMLGAASLYRYYSQPPLLGVKPQAELVVANSNGRDAMICTGFTRTPLEYYVRQLGGSISFFSFPVSSGLHRGWIDESELSNSERLASDARTIVGELSRLLGGDGRLWVAHSRLAAQSTEPLLRALTWHSRREPCPGGGDRFGFSCWQLSTSN